MAPVYLVKAEVDWRSVHDMSWLGGGRVMHHWWRMVAVGKYSVGKQYWSAPLKGNQTLQGSVVECLRRKETALQPIKIITKWVNKGVGLG